MTYGIGAHVTDNRRSIYSTCKKEIVNKADTEAVEINYTTFMMKLTAGMFNFSFFFSFFVFS